MANINGPTHWGRASLLDALTGNKDTTLWYGDAPTLLHSPKTTDQVLPATPEDWPVGVFVAKYLITKTWLNSEASICTCKDHGTLILCLFQTFDLNSMKKPYWCYCKPSSLVLGPISWLGRASWSYESEVLHRAEGCCWELTEDYGHGSSQTEVAGVMTVSHDSAASQESPCLISGHSLQKGHRKAFIHSLICSLNKHPSPTVTTWSPFWVTHMSVTLSLIFINVLNSHQIPRSLPSLS